MERHHSRKKLNNRGMSLVEVIISITILGIVAIPVLHSLTTAMVYNSKARIRQDMTLKAESIMETFKAYDLETLQGMFAANSGIEGIEAGTNCDSYTAPDISLIENPPAAGIPFVINGLKDDKDKKYNVTITAKPNAPTQVLEMKNMDGTRDAVYTGKREYDKEASERAFQDINEAANKSAFIGYFDTLTDESGRSLEVVNVDGNPISNMDVESDGFKSYISLYDKRLKLVVKDDGSGNYVVTAKMVYRYYITNFPYYVVIYPAAPDDSYLEEGETAVAPPDEEELRGELRYLSRYPESGYLDFTVPMDGEEELEIYHNPKEAGLDRLFIYYYPQYSLSAKNDIIEIDNQAGIDSFSCFIIKQCAADINETRIGVFENGYSAKVEGHSAGSVFALYHNFGENIGNGSSTAQSDVSGFTNGDGESYTESGDFYETEVLSYELELVVTDAVTGQVVTTINSSMNEKIKVN